MTINRKLLSCVLISLLASGCASQAQSVQKLPEKPRPQVPDELMVQLPEPLHFQKTLNADFGIEEKKPTE